MAEKAYLSSGISESWRMAAEAISMYAIMRIRQRKQRLAAES
jgi:hypothetical protein